VKELLPWIFVSGGMGLTALYYGIAKHIPKPTEIEIQHLNPEAIKVLVDWNWAVNYTAIPLMGVGYLISSAALIAIFLKKKHGK
jgi:hypothetical protein